MASVRSIEQQYWSLSQQQVQLWSSETAVSLGEEILKREQSELEVGRGTRADVAEAQQRLEQFRLDFVTRTSDVITTERQLRNILGLPPADNRRIVPVTAPTEARMEPDWDASLAQMVAFQPDIVQQQLQVRVAELQLLLARNQLLPVLNFNALYQFNGLGDNLDSAEANMTGAALRAIDPLQAAQQRAAGVNSQPRDFTNFQQWQVGFTFAMPLGMRAPLANNKQAQLSLLRQRAFLQQIVHQTTHSLARFFVEVDANYKQFKTASRLRAAAAERLEAQKAFYEEGRITIDRYLDSVAQFADAVAREAQFKTTYNISIVALEEAKGTLLGYDNIAVAEGPSPRKAYIQARDQQAAHVQLPIPHDGPYHPKPINGPANPDPVVPMPPPDLGPEGPRPLLPAPVGPLGSAPHAGAAAGPRRRARYPLAGRRPGPPSRRWSPSRLRTSRLDPVRPRTCPRCPSRSTCPPCRRSDRDRTPDGRVLSRAGPFLPKGSARLHSRAGADTHRRTRVEPHPSSVVRVRFAPRVKTLLTLGSAFDQNESVESLRRGAIARSLV